MNATVRDLAPLHDSEQEISNEWLEATDPGCDLDEECIGFFDLERVEAYTPNPRACQYANDATLIGIVVERERFYDRAYCLRLFGDKTVRDIERRHKQHLLDLELG